MNSSIASWFTIRCVHWPLWLNKAIERSICDGQNGGWMKHHRFHDIWSPCDYFMTATCGLHNKKWWKIIFLTFINNELHNWSFYNFFVTNTVIPMFPYHKTTRVSDVIRKQQAEGQIWFTFLRTETNQFKYSSFAAWLSNFIRFYLSLKKLRKDKTTIEDEGEKLIMLIYLIVD